MWSAGAKGLQTAGLFVKFYSVGELNWYFMVMRIARRVSSWKLRTAMFQLSVFLRLRLLAAVPNGVQNIICTALSGNPDSGG